MLAQASVVGCSPSVETGAKSVGRIARLTDWPAHTDEHEWSGGCFELLAAAEGWMGAFGCCGSRFQGGEWGEGSVLGGR